MRQLILKVPKGHRTGIEIAVEKYEGKNTIVFPSDDKEVYILFLPNKTLNGFLKEIDFVENAEINWIPRGVLSLYPPKEEAPDEVADVQPKSSMEIYLGGIQSVGSIFGLIGYSMAAGIIVWIGLFTTTTYLLVAAMLIAPFAGPAMNAALGTAAGKLSLLKSSLLRYGLAIGTGIAGSFLLSVIFNLQILTPLMIEISHVSKVAIFLPIVAGFAGALNVCQSERDSLVSGAAVGILVAASLAPPTGLLGAGIYLMNGEVVLSSLFRILIQLLGIHLAATAVFYFYGKVTPGGIRFLKGKRIITILTVAVVIAGISMMMYWQFSKPPFLRKASMNTELTEALQKEMENIEGIRALENNVTFSDKKKNGKSIVTFKSTVLSADTLAAPAEIRQRIIRHMKKTLRFPDKNIYESYSVEVMED
ncbi:MAG: DUF389 domain-containing protein [Bacteroidia bacterium]